MSNDLTMYQDDLKPDLVITCSNAGVPVDLTVATTVKVIGVRAGVAVWSPRTVAGSTALGVVTMLWQAGDTATVGIIEVEVEVTWSGGKTQTFRPDGVVRVVSDLG